MDDPAYRWVWPIGRLAGGASVEQAEAEFATLAAGLMAERPDADDELGFGTENVVVGAFAPEFQGVESNERVEQFFDRLDERLSALPGVKATAQVAHLPMGLEWNSAAVVAQEDRSLPLDEWPRSGVNVASPGYFELMGIPLRSGRTFDDADDADASQVAVVNETAVRTLWQGLAPADVVGRMLQMENQGGATKVMVVGVVADSKYRSLTEEPTAYLWRPIRQEYAGLRRMLVAYEGAPEQVMAGLQRISRQVDERVGPIEMATLADNIDSALFVARTGSSLLGTIALLGLALASIGLYGVGATDPVTFVGVLAVLTLVALAACWVPASRASKVDPSTALRWD